MQFLIWLGLASLVAADASAQTPAATSLRIGIVTPVAAMTAAQKSIFEGIKLGAAEAAQTARLFGSDVRVFEASGDGRARGALPAARFLSSARKVQVLIAVAAADVDGVAKFADDHHLIFFNVAARGMPERSACRRNSFHVEASDLMYSNAAKQFAAARTAPPRPSSAPSSVVLWDSHLQRFGASQLNDRYAAAAKREMDGAAWAGWAAIKIASETTLRARSTDAAKMIAYVEAPTTEFDGHKGWPLSFRPADHQLRQPLYIVVASPDGSAAASPRVIDIPDLRAVSTAGSDRASVDALDRLSAGSTVRCAWSAR